MLNAESDQQLALYLDFPSQSPAQVFQFSLKRRKRAVRPQRLILMAILEACRTPTLQHWIMVKARLGYDTLWKHMNVLMSRGLIDTSSDGHKTMYSMSDKGLAFLEELEASHD